MTVFRIVLALLLICAPMSEALAWGDCAHAAVAEIAQQHMRPEALFLIRDLLGGDKSLASLSGWADSISLLRPQTISWHFVNIPYESSRAAADRDRRPAPSDDSVIAAIERFQKILSDRSEPREQRLEALMFLIHLVADVHQPFHCVNRDDAGASELIVQFFGAPMSLHAVWDFGLIDRYTYDWGAFVREDGTQIDPALDEQARSGGVEDWALESHRLAVDFGYALPDSLEIDDGYYRKAIPIVRKQIHLAAIRLAVLLENALLN